MADLIHLTIIIYDLDGVLIDAGPANRAFYDHILSRFKLPPLTPEQWRAIQPLTSQDAVDLLFQGHPAREAAQEYQKALDNRPFLPLLRTEPYLSATLTRLRRRYRLALATNRGRSLPLVLESLHLGQYFDVVVGSLDVVHPKPHPECLQRILAHFQAEPRQACYIGDHDLDRQTARNAGMAFGAYRNPHLAADFHLESHLELLALLGESVS